MPAIEEAVPIFGTNSRENTLLLVQQECFTRTPVSPNKRILSNAEELQNFLGSDATEIDGLFWFNKATVKKGSERKDCIVQYGQGAIPLYDVELEDWTPIYPGIVFPAWKALSFIDTYAERKTALMEWFSIFNDYSFHANAILYGQLPVVRLPNNQCYYPGRGETVIDPLGRPVYQMLGAISDEKGVRHPEHILFKEGLPIARGREWSDPYNNGWPVGDYSERLKHFRREDLLC